MWVDVNIAVVAKEESNAPKKVFHQNKQRRKFAFYGFYIFLCIENKNLQR